MRILFQAKILILVLSLFVNGCQTISNKRENVISNSTNNNLNLEKGDSHNKITNESFHKIENGMDYIEINSDNYINFLLCSNGKIKELTKKYEDKVIHYQEARKTRPGNMPDFGNKYFNNLKEYKKNPYKICPIDKLFIEEYLTNYCNSKNFGTLKNYYFQASNQHNVYPKIFYKCSQVKKELQQAKEIDNFKNIGIYKKACSSIGFENQTNDFNQCIIELHKKKNDLKVFKLEDYSVNKNVTNNLNEYSSYTEAKKKCSKKKMITIFENNSWICYQPNINNNYVRSDNDNTNVVKVLSNLLEIGILLGAGYYLGTSLNTGSTFLNSATTIDPGVLCATGLAGVCN